MSETEQEPATEPQEPQEPLPGDELAPDEAEAEEAEEAAQEPAEPATEPPEEPVALSPHEIVLEKRRTQAERKWQAHEKRIRELYEEESEYLYPCPLCPDQHRGLIDIRFAGMVPDDLADAALAYIRGAEQVHYLPAQNVSECPVCGGHGKVLSGSRVAGKDLITCVSCKGYGFVPPLGAGDNGRPGEQPALVAVGAEEGPVSTEDKDIWGSPHFLADGQENPNYGRMVQYKDPRLP